MAHQQTRITQVAEKNGLDMSTLLKDLYSPVFYRNFAEVLEYTLPPFDRVEFQRRIFNAEFNELELKQRMSHTTAVLADFLGQGFATAVDYICRLIDNLRAAGITEQSLEYMFLPEFIERYGLDDYQTSIQAFEYVTQYTSCEFAVRPFIQKYGEHMLEQMQRWSNHENNMVRRLASEGSRPRLPWAMALPELKSDPAPLLPILENLKHDKCGIVRRSVANSLNDISKDNPEVTIDVARRWLGSRPETDALVKHGCRTLLKQGNPETLMMFGYDNRDLELLDFRLLSPRVKMGDQLEFSFAIDNRSEKAKLLRIEYAIYLLKKNGSLAKKVFKISERELEAGGHLGINKQHRFKPITTRVYYSGRHEAAVIINGKESESVAFELAVD